jgi:hypothetical protein
MYISSETRKWMLRMRGSSARCNTSATLEWACGVEGWDYGLAPVYVYPASD